MGRREMESNYAAHFPTPTTCYEVPLLLVTLVSLLVYFTFTVSIVFRMRDTIW
jgi:hypothetical protein